VLITGATGLIGSILVRALSAANDEHSLNMHIIAHGRNHDKGLALAQSCGVLPISGDICAPLPREALPDAIGYIFHCAALTSSADMVAKPVEVIATAVDGTRNMLELAKERHCSSFVYLSSMEVYGQTELQEVRENDLGHLDLSNPRSSYPESKRLCEALCVAYASQHGVPAKIARLARTFGAGAPNDPGDKRVANQFTRSLLAGEDIVLHTMGNSISNACYTADTIRGLLTVLLKGTDGEAYNITNPAASTTIREMADMLASKVSGGKIKVVINVPEDLTKRGYAPNVGFVLNADKLRALGWSPKHGLEDMFKRMLEDWQWMSTFSHPL